MNILKASEHLKLYFELWVDNEGDPQVDILILNTPTTEILMMMMSLDGTVQNQECQVDEQCKFTSNITSILTSAQVSRTNADDLVKIRKRNIEAQLDGRKAQQQLTL